MSNEPKAYVGRPIEEVIYDYAVTRGDLTEQYARDQLARVFHTREAAAEQRGRDAVLADVEALKDEWARAADDLAPDDDWGDSVEDTLRADFFREKGRHLRALIAKHRKTDHHDGSDR